MTSLIFYFYVSIITRVIPTTDGTRKQERDFRALARGGCALSDPIHRVASHARAGRLMDQRSLVGYSTATHTLLVDIMRSTIIAYSKMLEGASQLPKTFLSSILSGNQYDHTARTESRPQRLNERGSVQRGVMLCAHAPRKNLDGSA
jgi:hypothetical protein